MKQLLVVDGYNIIHDWPELRALTEKTGLDAARDRLLETLADYSGFYQLDVVVVFDAYKTDRMSLTLETRAGVEVVFTRKAETADQYIERLVDSLDPRAVQVRVATSDAMEQTVALGRGAIRMSARELQEEVRVARRERKQVLERRVRVKPNTLGSLLPQETLEAIARMIQEGEE